MNDTKQFYQALARRIMNVDGEYVLTGPSPVDLEPFRDMARREARRGKSVFATVYDRCENVHLAGAQVKNKSCHEASPVGDGLHLPPDPHSRREK